ncbi:MAG: adenylyl-sulfate kinase [Pseudomonadota bacterium]
MADNSLSPHLFWQELAVDKPQRAARLKQKPMAIWFTGLSGAGKSTVANAVESVLHARGYATYLLDGDNVRHGLCRDLGFADSDRAENVRRVGESARLMVDAGLVVLASFISPSLRERNAVRARFEAGEFFEIYISTPLDICEKRDPKGLYRLARRGELKLFTGISSLYEPPVQPDLQLDTSQLCLADCVEQVVTFIAQRQ